MHTSLASVTPIALRGIPAFLLNVSHILGNVLPTGTFACRFVDSMETLHCLDYWSWCIVWYVGIAAFTPFIYCSCLACKYWIKFDCKINDMMDLNESLSFCLTKSPNIFLIKLKLDSPAIFLHLSASLLNTALVWDAKSFSSTPAKVECFVANIKSFMCGATVTSATNGIQLWNLILQYQRYPKFFGMLHFFHGSFLSVSWLEDMLTW